jgi:uncharacterized membrane protein YozB (DUF420 family)
MSPRLLSTLPLVNAVLNGIRALLLLTGYFLIRRRKVMPRKVCMVVTFCSSTLFLISYLTYHYHVGSVAFRGTGALRTVYFTILISHTSLAGRRNRW